MIRLLWTGGPVDFDGEFFHLTEAWAHPAPEPPPRIIIGGEKPAGARLAARAGDGWTTNAADYEELLPIHLAELSEHGRSRAEIDHLLAVRAGPRRAARTPAAHRRHGGFLAEWQEQGRGRDGRQLGAPGRAAGAAGCAPAGAGSSIGNRASAQSDRMLRRSPIRHRSRYVRHAGAPRPAARHVPQLRPANAARRVAVRARQPGAHQVPSSTQVHGTILIGVIGGFMLLLLLFRFAAAGIGPFTVAVSPASRRGPTAASSRRRGDERRDAPGRRELPHLAGGAPDYRDYVFFTEPIPAGETRSSRKSLPPPTTALSRSPVAAVAVRCN